jgi:signal transduction histidine kinase
MLASSVLLDLPPTPEQQRKHAEMIKRCAKEMDRLIADLLDVSRMEAGTFAVRLESMHVGPVVAEILERCQGAARTRDVHLQSEIATDLPAIRGDEQRLGQAISNLVTNAIKFTPPSGRVCVRAQQRSAQVEIVVQDTGCGIATDALSSIFDRFWQANRTSGGAGLGLAIVKGIVESHGGEIAVESTEGLGTTFRILVPSIT